MVASRPPCADRTRKEIRKSNRRKVETLSQVRPLRAGAYVGGGLTRIIIIGLHAHMHGARKESAGELNPLESDKMA
eukprot:8277270-Pyramimonas_sp.AAC.1